MSNISINNFNNICRTCSQTNNLISIQENIYLIDILLNTVQIQIQLNDELPKNICFKCVEDLNKSYTFISKCRTTDAGFKQCLMQQKLLNPRKTPKKNKPEPPKITEELKITEVLKTTEEIFIKTEPSDINVSKTETFDINDSITDSDDSIIPPDQPEFEKSIQPQKYASIQPHYEDVCSNFNKSFEADPEFNLNDCQFTNLLEPMDLNESSDDDQANSSNLSEKSRTKYQREYSLFVAHCKQNNLTEFTEDVVLDYFLEKAKTVKSATLWCTYSMLKATLIEDNVDISKYPKLVEFLKTKSVDCKGKVTFTREQINRFLRDAPDATYLLIKVALIMGIAGGCHIDELMRMRIEHIDDKDSVLIVTIPSTVPKTNKTRTFVITSADANWMIIYRKYYKLRVAVNAEHRRLFLKYRDGKFINQPVGKNTFGRFPKLIAEFLNLANPAQYTGHCFRRTSALWFNNRKQRKSNVDEDDSS